MLWGYEYLDQIVNLEFKDSHHHQGATALRYAAARAAQGDRPVCGDIARTLASRLDAAGGTVILVTGTGNPTWLPYGESDGPSGIAILARVFGALGVRSCVLTEAPFLPGVRAAVVAAGSPLLSEDAWRQRSNGALVLEYPTGAEAGRQFLDGLLRDHPDVRAAIFVEKPGPNAAGVFHNSSGKPKDDDWVAHAHQLAERASALGIATVAVGDGGNEIGFGALREHLLDGHPYARDCGCPCGAGILNATTVDHMLPASVSNWGAYAIALALCLTMGRLDAIPDWSAVEASIKASVAAGAYDGYSGLAVPSVDGVSLAANQAIYTLMNEAVRISV